MDNSSPHTGDRIHYTLTASDNGPSASTGVSVKDLWPSGLTFVSATSSAGTYATSTETWTIGTLPDNATATLMLTATVNANTASSTITNTAIASESPSETDPTGNNSSSVSINVQPNVCTSNCGGNTADISVVKTVDNANPVAGATVNYTVTVADLGPGTSTFVEVTDLLPSGISIASMAVSQGSSTDGGTLDWNVGTLAPDATATLTVAAVVGSNEAGQTITNTATVSQLRFDR